MWTLQDREDADIVVLHLRIIWKPVQLVGLRARTRKSVIFEKKTSHSCHAARYFFFIFLFWKKYPQNHTVPSVFWPTPVPSRAPPAPLSFFSPFWIRRTRHRAANGVWKTTPPPKKKKKKTGLGVRWRWREGGYRKKKIKAKSAECVLSEAAAQLNWAGPSPVKRNGDSLNAN